MLDNIKAVVLPLLDNNGVELVELIWRQEGRGMVLRLLVDRPGGITIDDCAKLNVLIGAALDEADLIYQPYILEVSSPGLDRLLKTDDDFRRAQGDEIWINIKEPINGKKGFEGTIEAADKDKIKLRNNKGIEVEIDLGNVLAAGRKIDV